MTPRDFRDPSFKANLRETTEELLNMARVVPVFNENDAISDRTRVRPAHTQAQGQSRQFLSAAEALPLRVACPRTCRRASQ